MLAITGQLVILMRRFTGFLDVDHGKQGIRTFALHPGGVKTGDSEASVHCLLIRRAALACEQQRKAMAFGNPPGSFRQ